MHLRLLFCGVSPPERQGNFKTHKTQGGGYREEKVRKAEIKFRLPSVVFSLSNWFKSTWMIRHPDERYTYFQYNVFLYIRAVEILGLA